MMKISPLDWFLLRDLSKKGDATVVTLFKAHIHKSRLKSKYITFDLINI